MSFSVAYRRWLTFTSATLLTGLAVSSAQAAPLNLSDSPLFLTTSSAPLNMLVVGRDHKLYYEAYNDASDLDGDGTLDVGYKPTKITYYGYFDSGKCYTYGSGIFTPSNAATDKKCPGKWSGDFLNYLTTARIDALRKVLYGGSRFTDSTTETVLQRTHLPQDAHSWGKEYESVARDGYDITQYSPLALPTPGTRHLFANTTLLNDASQLPRLRVLQNRTNRIWEWVSIERPVAGGDVLGSTGARTAVTPTDYTVRVKVCVSGLAEDNCRRYPGGSLKPIGLLQEYGENDSMLFGLLTGSYNKNTSGGVLRKPVGQLMNNSNASLDEIDKSTGQFRTSVNGILSTLDKLKVTGFGGNYEYSCGWITTRAINEGECKMWGNPIAEMMYEALRYFSGKGSATSVFATSSGDDGTLGLPVASWNNPYANSNSACAKPFTTVISDINPSYDSDQLPGTSFGGGLSNDLPGPGLNVSKIGDLIWSKEPDLGGTRLQFIGESKSDTKGGIGAPTAKDVTSFGNIRGLSPEEPTKQGSYYSASVAYYGLMNDLSSITGAQKNQTFAVALASPLPRISIPVNGHKVTLVPFAKSVAGSSISSTSTFQPTNQIVDFYVDTYSATSGRFRVNFEDVEQGADHDMDAIVVYEYNVVGGQVQVKLSSEYAYGGITQHMGYVISGTTRDGIYLDVLDRRDGDTATDTDYYLDTSPSFNGIFPVPSNGTGRWNDGAALPFSSTRTFTPGASEGATLLKDPLWYAAKWGGFTDSDRDNTPNLQSEWDGNGDKNPDNYFLVTNALTLSQQLREAFDEILARVGTAASASVNSGSINSDTRVFQARFNSADWSGELLSYGVNSNGSLDATRFWNAADTGKIPESNARKIITINTNGTGVPFRWDRIDSTRKTQLQPTDPSDALRGQDRLLYIRGDHAKELRTGGTGATFRNRSGRLGDIINSAPAYVGRPSFVYRDSLESQPYSTFRRTHAGRAGMVYVGANDGMLHAFESESGKEVFAYVPGAVFQNLHQLTDTAYAHRYFVDGAPTVIDAFIGGAWRTVLASGLNKGGQGVFALDVTDPGSATEANADPISLWEFTDANDLDMGYSFSRPAIVRMANGKWAAIFGNGYNNTTPDGRASTSGNAVLYIVDLQTGALIRKIDTGVGTSAPYSGDKPNGLATPAAIDTQGDDIVDFAYAGDLFGNLWKFDLRGSDPTKWDVAYKTGTPAVATPIFVSLRGTARQPITERPEVMRGPESQGFMVLFGTGKYLEGSDEIVTSLTPQSFYGIWDRNGGTSDDVVTRDKLVEQKITGEFSAEFDVNPDPEKVEIKKVGVRTSTKNPLDTANKRGWYIDLISPTKGFEGEMQVTDPVLRSGRVVFTTLIPNPDVCAYGGTSWLMEMDALTGGRLNETPIDLNGDGLFDEEDLVKNPETGDPEIPITGVMTDVGITPKPAVLLGKDEKGQLKEFKFLPGTSGEMQIYEESTGDNLLERQSWRQLR